MKRVVIFLTEVVLPIAVAIVLAAVFRNMNIGNDGCLFLYVLMAVGIPSGIKHMWSWVLLKNLDLTMTVGLMFISVFIGSVIGGVVYIWHIFKGILKTIKG